jgi:hypothetical protein
MGWAGTSIFQTSDFPRFCSPPTSVSVPTTKHLRLPFNISEAKSVQGTLQAEPKPLTREFSEEPLTRKSSTIREGEGESSSTNYHQEVTMLGSWG